MYKLVTDDSSLVLILCLPPTTPLILCHSWSIVLDVSAHFIGWIDLAIARIILTRAWFRFESSACTVEDAVFLASGNGFERLGVPLTVEHEPLMVAKK